MRCRRDWIGVSAGSSGSLRLVSIPTMLFGALPCPLGSDARLSGPPKGVNPVAKDMERAERGDDFLAGVWVLLEFQMQSVVGLVQSLSERHPELSVSGPVVAVEAATVPRHLVVMSQQFLEEFTDRVHQWVDGVPRFTCGAHTLDWVSPH